jgi:hypothetical protein
MGKAKIKDKHTGDFSEGQQDNKYQDQKKLLNMTFSSAKAIRLPASSI